MEEKKEKEIQEVKQKTKDNKKIKIRKSKTIEEFKNFIMKGNVLDMAVGVIIGGAFGKIVTSLVNDILMPAISLLTGQIDLGSLKFERAITDTMSINLNYGVFLQTIIDFLIISISIFVVVKLVSKLSKKKEEVLIKAEPPKQEVLLTEIRDLLKAKK